MKTRSNSRSSTEINFQSRYLSSNVRECSFLCVAHLFLSAELNAKRHFLLSAIHGNSERQFHHRWIERWAAHLNSKTHDLSFIGQRPRTSAVHPHDSAAPFIRWSSTRPFQTARRRAVQTTPQARSRKGETCFSRWARNSPRSWTGRACIGQPVSALLCMHHPQRWRDLHPNWPAPGGEKSGHSLKVHTI